MLPVPTRRQATEVSMTQLIRVDGAEGGTCKDLGAGRLSLGRAADNDVVLEDGSVSQHHCEVERSGNEIRVRDLGSLNGTWIEGVQVSEGALRPGQSLQVGAIRFVLQTTTGSESSLSPVSARWNGRESIDATEEEISDGWLHCPRCAKWHAPEMTKERRLGTTILRFCPRCGGPCTGSIPSVKGADERREMTFWQGVRGAFSYPWRGSGSTVLLAGAVTLTIADYAALFAAFAFLLGLIALLFLFVGVGGYLFAFLKDVVASSCQGDETLPSWPEVTSPADFALPFFQFIGLSLFCWGPLLLWRIWGPDNASGWIILLLMLVGAGYFPMALVGVSLSNSIGGMNPLVIVPAIVRIPGHYLVAVLLVFGLMVVQWLGSEIGGAIPIPILPVFLTELLTLYLLVVIGRVLGMMYYVNRERLGWFRR